jgi:hypothetical protein
MNAHNACSSKCNVKITPFMLSLHKVLNYEEYEDVMFVHLFIHFSEGRPWTESV